MLVPAHAAVCDDEELQLPPPDPSQRGGSSGEFVDGGDRRNLVLGGGSVDRLVRHCGLALPANAPEEVPAGHHVSLLETGQLIYDLRTGTGLSQGALAERMGTTQSVVSRLEEGGGATNRLDTIAQPLP